MIMNQGKGWFLDPDHKLLEYQFSETVTISQSLAVRKLLVGKPYPGSLTAQLSEIKTSDDVTLPSSIFPDM